MNIRVVIFEDNHNLREGLYQLINGSHEFDCVGAYAKLQLASEKILKNLNLTWYSWILKCQA